MALAALSGLRRLSLSTSLNTPHSLTAVTCLPHLTALQVSPLHDTLVLSSLCCAHGTLPDECLFVPGTLG